MKYQKHLEIVREFQKALPESHVGGSIGLFLQGVELGRDLSASDLDLTAPEPYSEVQISKLGSEGIVEGSDPDDFDAVYYYGFGTNQIRIDVRVCPEPSFDVIEYEGHTYNVSKKRDILFWKEKYARKQGKSQAKHIADLKACGITVEPTPTEPVKILDL